MLGRVASTSRRQCWGGWGKLTPMSGPLTGKRALVIGGTSGIGLATARLLALDGASVWVASRTQPRLDAAVDELADVGAHVHPLVCDGMDGAQVKAAVDAASDGEGRLDIAVAVPGGGSIRPVLLYGDDEFGDDIDRNVRPVFLALKYAGRAMVRNGGGAFVAISSTAAVFSSRYLAGYCAAKAAVDQLVSVAADELGEYGVRVNAVRPGLTETAATSGMFRNDTMLAAFLEEQPLKRSGSPDDIAAAIRYLCGPEAGWVTGQHLTVDGGHTLRRFIDYRTLIAIPDQGEAARADVS